MKPLLLGIAFLLCCKEEAPAPASSPAVPPPARAPRDLGPTQAAFDTIYRNAWWGKNDAGVGHSGTGSTLDATKEYRAYLQKFLADHQIKSVVDAGCGDWEFSQAIDWTGIDYKGFDIVERVIAGNRQRYARPGIRFFVGNIVEDDLPPADLLLSKHVLQHLPDTDVKTFLAKQLPKYKHALITNGVDATTRTATHEADIAAGGYRHLDITKPPFGVDGEHVLYYWDGHHEHAVVHVERSP